MNFGTRATYGFNTGTTSTASGGCGLTSNAASVVTPTEGDGDGQIGDPVNLYQGGGESGCYWVDLSSAVAGNLIEGGFFSANEDISLLPTPSSTQLPLYFPTAKIGGGNMIYVYTMGGSNYYDLSNVLGLGAGFIHSTGSLSPSQAYNIDKKVDDGYPNSGNVFAWYETRGSDFTAYIVPSISNSPAVAGDCWDDTGALLNRDWPPENYLPLQGAPGAYATSINGGQGSGCGLSFKFQ